MLNFRYMLFHSVVVSSYINIRTFAGNIFIETHNPPGVGARVKFVDARDSPGDHLTRSGLEHCRALDLVQL